MKFLSNSSRLTNDQYKAVSAAESVINSVDFKGWFLRAKFSEMGKLENCSANDLYMKFFVDDEYRFTWVLIDRPWYKRFSSTIGMTDIENKTISTYKQVFDKMDISERAAHFAHEMMHVIGFTHSFKKSDSRDKSLPYQVGNYVEAAVKVFNR